MAETTKGPHGHEHDPHDEGMGENKNIAWERRDLSPFQITAFGIGLLFACVTVAFMMWGLFDFLYSRESAKNPKDVPAMMKERATMKPHEPRLQADPRTEIKDLRESEAGILENYGWLDPDKGTVRIPIEAAMDLTLKKGLPSKPSAAGSANEGFRMIPEGSSGGRTLEKISQ